MKRAASPSFVTYPWGIVLESATRPGHPRVYMSHGQAVAAIEKLSDLVTAKLTVIQTRTGGSFMVAVNDREFAPPKPAATTIGGVTAYYTPDSEHYRQT